MAAGGGTVLELAPEHGEATHHGAIVADPHVGGTVLRGRIRARSELAPVGRIAGDEGAIAAVLGILGAEEDGWIVRAGPELAPVRRIARGEGGAIAAVLDVRGAEDLGLLLLLLLLLLFLLGGGDGDAPSPRGADRRDPVAGGVAAPAADAAPATLRILPQALVEGIGYGGHGRPGLAPAQRVQVGLGRSGSDRCRAVRVGGALGLAAHLGARRRPSPRRGAQARVGEAAWQVVGVPRTGGDAVRGAHVGSGTGLEAPQSSPLGGDGRGSGRTGQGEERGEYPEDAHGGSGD